MEMLSLTIQRYYQKAYTAACRLMTVLEEALDSLINGTVV